MLGSAAEAEDVVQDAWLRWQTTDRSVVENAAAFLTTTTTGLAINVAQSAQARRETYVGPWLPEPVDTSADPQLGAERGEALQFAVLVLMEKLSPTERAAYILREAFDHPYQDIAEILRLSEENTRQLVSRARKHIADERRTPVSAVEQNRLLQAFIAAAQTGDLAGLENLLAEQAVSYADGGGLVRAAPGAVPLSSQQATDSSSAAGVPRLHAQATEIKNCCRPAEAPRRPRWHRGSRRSQRSSAGFSLACR